MRNIINFVNPSIDTIQCELSMFPDGQRQVAITGFEISMEVFPVEIKCRLNNFQDLELIICTVKSLRNLGVKEIHLYVPYFLGSRSDRQFDKYSNNYLKDVICPIINSLQLASITVTDTHSDVLEACLINFKKESNEEVAKWALGEIYNYDSNEGNNNMVLLSPDAGANKKIYALAEQIGYEWEIITCSKIRDLKTGRILETVIPDSGFDRENKDFILIDDICDGGRTFIEIAKALKTKSYFTGKLYLIVTHGIFSNGFGELSQYFEGIYCTNSYKDIVQPNVDMQVKQLNIF